MVTPLVHSKQSSLTFTTHSMVMIKLFLCLINYVVDVYLATLLAAQDHTAAKGKMIVE